MAKTPTGFVSLKSVTQGTPDAATALADIRQLYFKTTSQTIENDFAHAIELLKTLPDEESRAKAHVYMEGLSEMRKDWAKRSGAIGTRGARGSGAKGKVSSGGSGPLRPRKPRDGGQDDPDA
jgi:hypothetical protein